VRTFVEQDSLLALDNKELFTEIEVLLKKFEYNVLNYVVDDKRIQLFVQTEKGLEELVIDDNLFTNLLFGEAKYVYERLTERGHHELFDGKDILEVLAEIEETAKKGAYIQRYKGLGEMNPSQLWETTMNKEDRRLLQVKIDDCESASASFNLFMGDEVEPRRAYIEQHAKDVVHLDI
jgi:DNA gyrase subunit B